MKTLDQVRKLADVDVVGALDRLMVKDRRLGADIVAHLLVVKERSIYLDLGHPSIVAYCEERLGCSKDMAFKRSAAVRVAERNPEVLEWLLTGEMTLSGLAVLASHRDDRDLVRSACGKSKRQIEELVAATYPDDALPRGGARTRPVAEGLSRLEVRLPNEVLEQIEEALDLDSHVNPTRNVGELLSRALECYVSARKKERFGVGAKPRTAKAQPTQTIPADKRRETFERSGGRCEYVAPDGRRCSSRAFAELDHVVARARGGTHDMIRMLCNDHNQHAADEQLGAEHMDRARRRASTARDLNLALKTAGFRVAEARSLADAALRSLGPDAELTDLMREALRVYPLPIRACEGRVLYTPRLVPVPRQSAN
jgi:5-methylcytosine-specific restriction endonuclease McrA